ncbi:MAG: biliverdin-producing heme oxygenase, partial [Bacteroidetes bacterium]|nr:biliverdin-producing heme oxygenase [Bacteroidota bacterium]
IAGMISKQLNRSPEEGFSFFDPYGEATREKWNAFREKLEYPFSETEQETVIRTANATFLTFKQWVDQHEPATSE